METSFEDFRGAFAKAQTSGLKISSDYAIDAVRGSNDSLIHAIGCPQAQKHGADDWQELPEAVKKLDQWCACMVDALAYNGGSLSTFRAPEITFIVNRTLNLSADLDYDKSSFEECVKALKALTFLADVHVTCEESSVPYAREEGFFTKASLKKSGLPTGGVLDKKINKLAEFIADSFPKETVVELSSSLEDAQALFSVNALADLNHTLLDSHEMLPEWDVRMGIEREEDGTNGLSVLEEMLDAGFKFRLISALFKSLELDEVGLISWAVVPIAVITTAIKLGYQPREYVILPQLFTPTGAETLATIARLRVQEKEKKEVAQGYAYVEDGEPSYEPFLKAYESFKNL